MHAPQGRVIVEFQDGNDWELDGSILTPSEKERRHMMKKQDMRIITPDTPYIYLWGTLISGECEAPKDSQVLFNRHDGELIERDKKKYYSIPTQFILAYRS